MLNSYFITRIKKISDVVFLSPNIILALLTCYCFFILLQVGMVGDDAYNAQILGKLIEESKSLLEGTYDVTAQWYLNNKRILLGYYFIFPIFYYIHDFVTIKLLSIGIILISLLSFNYLLTLTAGLKNLAFLASFFVLMLIQFRDWHDPILIFPSHLMPYIAVLVFFSLICFFFYLKTKKLFLIICASVFYMVAIFSYEVAIILFPLFLLIAYLNNQNFRDTLQKSLPIIVVLACYLLCYIVAVLIFPDDASNLYPTFNQEFHAYLFLKALFFQLGSALPGSYYLSNLNTTSLDFKLYDLFIFIFTFSLLFSILKKISLLSITKKHFYFLLLSGLILYIAPAILSAISSHQSEIIQMGFGYGYITVYFQYFGFSILLSLLVYKFLVMPKSSFLNKLLIIILTSIFSSIFIVNALSNRSVALKTNPSNKFPQELQASSIAKGLMSDIKPNDYLVRSMRYANDWKWSYYKLLNKKFTLCDFNNQSYSNGNNKLMSLNQCLFNKDFYFIPVNSYMDQYFPNKDVYLISYHLDALNGQRGQVFFAHLNSFFVSNESEKVIHINATLLKSYDQYTNRISLHDDDINFMTLFQYESINNKLINLNDLVFLPNKIFSFNTGEIHPTEHSLTGSLQWVSGDFFLNIFNSEDRQIAVTVTANILNPSIQKFSISLSEDSFNKMIHIDKPTQQLNEEVLLNPGINKIEIINTGQPIKNGDPRNIIYGLENILIQQN